MQDTAEHTKNILVAEVHAVKCSMSSGQLSFFFLDPVTLAALLHRLLMGDQASFTIQ